MCGINFNSFTGWPAIINPPLAKRATKRYRIFLGNTQNEWWRIRIIRENLQFADWFSFLIFTGRPPPFVLALHFSPLPSFSRPLPPRKRSPGNVYFRLFHQGICSAYPMAQILGEKKLSLGAHADKEFTTHATELSERKTKITTIPSHFSTFSIFLSISHFFAFFLFSFFKRRPKCPPRSEIHRSMRIANSPHAFDAVSWSNFLTARVMQARKSL